MTIVELPHRTVVVARIAIAEWPNTPPWGAGPFALLQVVDSLDGLEAFAKRVVGSGLCLSACWGSFCREAEDCVDHEIVMQGADRDGVVLTTSHSKESLEDALDYFLVVGLGIETATEPVWVINVSSEAQLARVVRHLEALASELGN